MAAKKAPANVLKITRPEDLARVLGISGKVVRAYLRATFTRPVEAKNTSWSLTPKMVEQTYAHFQARMPKNA
jgi:hypothetical protein